MPGKPGAAVGWSRVATKSWKRGEKEEVRYGVGDVDMKIVAGEDIGGKYKGDTMADIAIVEGTVVGELKPDSMSMKRRGDISDWGDGENSASTWMFPQERDKISVLWIKGAREGLPEPYWA